MQFSTSSSPFTPSNNSVHRVMRKVLLALLPAIGVSYWLFGYSVIIQLLLACITALITEAALLSLRRRAIKSTLFDLSALITAALLALSIPSIAPWWIIVSGTVFSISIAKHLYGGLGYNPFNPAMVGYVFLLISFPQQMTAWQNPSLFLSLENASSLLFSSATLDGISSATLLDNAKTQLSLGKNLIHQALQFKNQQLMLAIAYALGGFYLLISKTITWHLPCALLVGLLLPATLAQLINPELYHSPLIHLLSGASLFAAFFIITDPVTAATSNKARLVYGLLVGLLIYIIRTWGAYPDAVAFAILLGNLSAPSIDHYLHK